MPDDAPGAQLRGREPELARTAEVLDRATRLGVGATLVISGPSGIGKTTLARAVMHQARARQVVVAATTCDEVHRIRPGAPVIAAMRAGRDPLVDEAGYRELVASADDPFGLAELVAGRLEEATVAGPVLLVVDDAQWADPTTEFVLRRVRTRTTGLPLVVLLVTRAPGAPGLTGVGIDDPVEHLALAPLADRDVAALAEDHLGHPPEDRVRAMLAAADGHPFLVTEILRRAASADPQDRPDEPVLAGLRARWHDLPGIAAQVAALVATGGPMRLADVVAVLADRPAVEVEAAVTTAQQAGLLDVAGGEVSFRHDLVRAAVTAAASEPLLRDLRHRLAAWHLDRGEPFEAAAHARAAARPGDVSAARIMVAAAELLLDAAVSDAADLALSAYTTMPLTSPGWQEMALRVLAVLARTQRPLDTVAVADAVLARTDDADIAGRVESRTAQALWLSGRLALLVERVDRVLARADDLTPAIAARLRAVRALARTRLTVGRVAAAEASQALALARAVDDGQAVELALQASGEAAKNEGRHADALGHFRELRVRRNATAIAEEVMQLQLLDRYDHAQTLLDAAFTRHGAAGSVLPSLLFAQMWQHFNLGKLDEAAAGAATLVDIAQELGNGVHTIDALLILSAVRLTNGDLPGCAAYLARAADLTDADDDIRMPGLTLMRAWYSATTGDVRGAMELLRPALFSARESRTYWPWWPGWMNVIFGIAGAANDREAALEAVELAELGAARNPGVVTFEGIAIQLRAVFEGDVDGIGRAAAVLERSPRPAVRGASHEMYGAALLARGERDRGLRELDLAWDLFLFLGSHRSRAGVQRLMREAGTRRRKWASVPSRPASGWPALTTAERRVAVLVAAGRTNKSVAAELNVSVNTVASQLKSVFVKLDVESRVQLANAVHARQALS